MLPNHHLSKPVLIGEIQADGQINIVWKTPGVDEGRELVALHPREREPRRRSNPPLGAAPASLRRRHPAKGIMTAFILRIFVLLLLALPARAQDALHRRAARPGRRVQRHRRHGRQARHARRPARPAACCRRCRTASCRRRPMAACCCRTAPASPTPRPASRPMPRAPRPCGSTTASARRCAARSAGCSSSRPIRRERGAAAEAIFRGRSAEDVPLLQAAIAREQVPRCAGQHGARPRRGAARRARHEAAKRDAIAAARRRRLGRGPRVADRGAAPPIPSLRHRDRRRRSPPSRSSLRSAAWRRRCSRASRSARCCCWPRSASPSPSA